ncbi:MAG: hypothetical protein BroJett042_20460 [Bacteroidota bacterium]|nr:MAG: hypothetical protein BroJett042_20460 [Bacteroidota bacterium]
MRKYSRLGKFIAIIGLPILIASCEDETTVKTTVDFASISSNYYEADGTTSFTIPLRNAGSTSGLSVVFAGTATQGQDYELVGITSAGVEIRLLDDNVYEDGVVETLRVQLVSSSESLKGNTMHTINMVSNDCEDTEGLTVASLAGDWNAMEDDYGPYTVTFEVDEEDETILWMDNFFDSGISAYVKIDLTTGAVVFPEQQVSNYQGSVITGTGSFDDNCNFTITTHFATTQYGNFDWEYIFYR